MVIPLLLDMARMKSSSSTLSPPPSPHPAPVPVSSTTSSLNCCPELDLSITLSPGHTHMKTSLLKMCQQSDRSQLKTHPRGQMGRKGDTQVTFEEPLVITVTPDIQIPPNTMPQQPIRAQRNSRGRHNAHRQWVEPFDVASNEDPGFLEGVELNTALALKAEFQSLQGVEFNSQKAIQETLLSSKRTKNLIDTRACEVVNVSRSQLLYTSLVSVDVQKDQLISQVMHDKLLLAPPPRCHGNKTADGPSFLPFLTSDLFRQKPLPPVEEPANIMPHAVTHYAHSTFDLFRRQWRYEATP